MTIKEVKNKIEELENAFISMSTKPKLQFEVINLDEPKVLYGDFAFGEIRYSLTEFLTLLTTDQMIQLKHRLDRELQLRMSD